jgi:hypothetical protein
METKHEACCSLELPSSLREVTPPPLPSVRMSPSRCERERSR